jgi:hypothetical protein
MTPKEKAIELISKLKPFADYQEDDCFNQIEKMLINAKHCALIAVDEIIESCNHINKWYWQEVKEEINNL